MKNKGLNKNVFVSSLWLIAFSVLLLCILPGCGSTSGKKKVLNDRITLRRVDKNPYGTYTAYENLKYMFPEAVI